MSLFVAPIIRDLNAPTAVRLGCGQQIVKKKTPFIKLYANPCNDSGVVTCADRHIRFP